MTRARRILCAAVLLAAPAGATLGPRYGGELTLATAAVPAAAGPAFATSPLDRTVGMLTHETLVRVPRDGTVEPALARAWASAADGREWTLTLAPDLRFHDGSAVTAADVVRSLRRFLRSPSPAAARWAEALVGGREFRAGTSQDLAGLTAPDGTHVVLRQVAAVPAPLAPLAAAAAAVTGASGAGAGPFVPGARSPRRLELGAFAGHVRGRPYLDRVSLVAVPDEDASAELDAGRVHVALSGGSQSPPAATVLLLLDPARAAFPDRAARAAAVASIDARQLVDHLVPGGEVPDALLPPDLLTALPPAPAPPTGRMLSGRATLVVGRDVPAAISQRVVACFADRGLAVDVRPTDPLLARDAPADARLLWWAPEVAETSLALRELVALARQEGAGALLAAADGERDPDRRRALYHRVESDLRDAGLVTALARVPLPVRARPDVHGLRVDAGSALRLEDAWRAP
ncbi:MAG: ABC transporter substrate-binding protein [Vicinamibacteria bacterium]